MVWFEGGRENEPRDLIRSPCKRVEANLGSRERLYLAPLKMAYNQDF